MANNRQGPRQPLSQRRPKTAAGKQVARVKAKVKPVVAKIAEKLAKPGKPSAKKAVSGKVAPIRRRPPAVPAVVYTRLQAQYPDAHCELDFASPFQLVVATILSAQCTDKRVNMVTPTLFSRYPTPEALARAKQEDVEEIIKSTGFFRNKAKSIIGMAGAVTDKHAGTVPSTLEELVVLPGVGRKTANVVLGNAFDINEGVVVDTHVGRLSLRLGLTTQSDPVKVEQDLIRLFPRAQWTMLAHLLIFHGRRVCEAKNPRCEECVLADTCPSSRVPA
ncbi:MAG TPA: endonuclease III [Gemmatimonadaceae bacterium]|nr:endonuclease III [Gemmatimonadaceae bacterium]